MTQPARACHYPPGQIKDPPARPGSSSPQRFTPETAAPGGRRPSGPLHLCQLYWAGQGAERVLGATSRLQHPPPLLRIHIGRIGRVDEIQQHLEEALGLVEVGKVARPLEQLETA